MSDDPKSHPDYHDGYFAALRGEPLTPYASYEFTKGFDAATYAADLLKGAGFKQGGANFSKTTVITP